MKCEKCGREMEFEEKDTSSGRDMRTHYCRHCDVRVDVDNGIALWKTPAPTREEHTLLVFRTARYS
jgi:hypothetical protein